MLRFSVLEGTEECLFEDVRAGSDVNAQVVVVREGLFDVRFKIIGPNSSVLFNELLFSRRDDAGNDLDAVRPKGHVFKARQTGQYAFCFDNTMSKFTGKVVHFDLVITPSTNSPDTDAGATTATAQSTTSGMQARTARLNEVVDNILQDQDYLYDREEVHRNTVESSNARVAWFTVAETLVFMAVSLFSVRTIRHWFDKPAGNQHTFSV